MLPKSANVSGKALKVCGLNKTLTGHQDSSSKELIKNMRCFKQFPEGEELGTWAKRFVGQILIILMNQIL